MSLPKHFRKPRHRKAVVATDRGWEVAETGELLVSYRGLATALRETVLTTGIAVDVTEDVVVDEVIDEVVTEDVVDEAPVVVTEDVAEDVVDEVKGPVVVTEPEVAVVVEEKPKKKMGRPRKNPLPEQK